MKHDVPTVIVDSGSSYRQPPEEITDEQIFKLAEMLELKMTHALYAFARTLIKKAQEK